MPAIAHIAGDPERLTAQQRDLIQLASTLGRERFAPRAERYDRDSICVPALLKMFEG
jgi:hypothetical protein